MTYLYFLRKYLNLIIEIINLISSVIFAFNSYNIFTNNFKNGCFANFLTFLILIDNILNIYLLYSNYIVDFFEDIHLINKFNILICKIRLIIILKILFMYLFFNLYTNKNECSEMSIQVYNLGYYYIMYFQIILVYLQGIFLFVNNIIPYSIPEIYFLPTYIPFDSEYEIREYIYNPGASETEINRLDIYTYYDNHIVGMNLNKKIDDLKCSICWNEFNNNDPLRYFICKHYFHMECCDQWLSISKLCPLCKRNLIN